MSSGADAPGAAGAFPPDGRAVVARRIGRIPARDVDRVFKIGRRFSRPELVLIVAPTASIDATPTIRLGVVVNRSVSKESVRRNRIKRLLRESFRLIVPTISESAGPGGADCVLLARPSARTWKGRGDADSVIRTLLGRWARA